MLTLDSKNKIKELDLTLSEFYQLLLKFVVSFWEQKFSKEKRSGPKPTISDPEIITLALMGQQLDSSEAAYYNFLRKNLQTGFPKWLERSRFHRRVKNLQKYIEVLHRFTVGLINLKRPSSSQLLHAIDSMPLSVCHLSRANRTMQFAADVGDHASLFGYCAAKKYSYYGFKLHLCVNFDGIITDYVLAPASFHDVTIAPELVENLKHTITLGDKGYIGLEVDPTNTLITPKRKNQKIQNTPIEKKLLKDYRKKIETTNSVLHEQFNITKTRARTLWGLKTRVIFKIAFYTILIYLNALHNIPLLNTKHWIN